MALIVTLLVITAFQCYACCQRPGYYSPDPGGGTVSGSEDPGDDATPPSSAGPYIKIVFSPRTQLNTLLGLRVLSVP